MSDVSEAEAFDRGRECGKREARDEIERLRALPAYREWNMRLIRLTRVFLTNAARPYDSDTETVLVNVDHIRCVMEHRHGGPFWKELAAQNKSVPASVVEFSEDGSAIDVRETVTEIEAREALGDN